MFSLPKLPNLILFPVSVKPLPIIVMLVPFGPALGLKLSIIGTIQYLKIPPRWEIKVALVRYNIGSLKQKGAA